MSCSVKWFLRCRTPPAGLLLVITALDATRLPLVRVVNDDERLLETWQGSHGVVAVAERPSGLRIKVNNFYRLGGSAAMFVQIPNQTAFIGQQFYFQGLLASSRVGLTRGLALRVGN